MKIILDTNFLLIPATLKVDIFAEIDRIMAINYDLNILDKTLDELDNIIQNQRGKHKLAAKLALQLIKAKNVKIIKTNKDKDVDSLIFDMAKTDKIIVATQDGILKSNLRPYAKAIISLRQKKYLTLSKDL